MIGLVMPGRRPKVVGCVDDHALLAGHCQIGRHAGPNHVGKLHQDRIDIRIDGIHPGRNEHP